MACVLLSLEILNKGLALPTVDGVSFMDANISFGKVRYNIGQRFEHS